MTRYQIQLEPLYMRLSTLNPPLLDFFYGDIALPPTFQSWFSLTHLHVWMVQSKLQNKKMNNALADQLHNDLQLKLYALGIDNVRIYDSYMKELMASYFGGNLAMDEGFEGGDAMLASALWRNVFLMDEAIETEKLVKMADYVRKQMSYVHSLSVEDLLENRVELNK
jgi:cytochrome b pre-mRNA-processing protein 3